MFGKMRSEEKMNDYTLATVKIWERLKEVAA